MVGDAELAVAAASGDRAALADIYDRYADSLHEMCRAVLHDAHEASDAVHDTFVIASTRLGQLRDPERLKPWLFAIARRESIRRSSKRARMRPSHDEVLDVPVVDDTAGGAIADDAAALVWEAANALTERERAVLVLNVRQGLEGADLADAAGLPGPQTSVILSRAKTQLAGAVRCTLLLRNGRTDCSELATIVPAAHRMLDGLTRKRVARHAQSCVICEPKWNASPDALGILAAAPLLGAPAALKRRTLDDIELISFSKPLGDGHWRADGFPPAEDAGNRRRPLIVSIAAALVMLVIAVGLVLAGNDDTPTLSATDQPDETTTTTAAPAFGPVTTLALDSTSTSSRRTTTTRRGATTTRPRPGTPGGGGAATTTPPTVPPPTAPPTTAALRITSTSGPRSVCAGDEATFTATVEGANPPAFMLLNYSSGNNQNGAGMQRSGNTYTAKVVIGNPGQYTWNVSGGGATSSSKSITVADCTAAPQ
ncbi:MAG: sigma-70 family RNA polymerase sigma factor [Acidimicrobiales bacterium]|nr:sigma-70 family RNA polymerase sigma factor [Acidimicrobiales bacterium]